MLNYFINKARSGVGVAALSLTVLLGSGCGDTYNITKDDSGQGGAVQDVNYDCEDFVDKLIQCGWDKGREKMLKECRGIGVPQEMPEFTQCTMEVSCDDLYAQVCNKYTHPI